MSQTALLRRTPFNSGRWSNYILQNERLLDPIQESLFECQRLVSSLLEEARTRVQRAPLPDPGLRFRNGGWRGLGQGAAQGRHMQGAPASQGLRAGPGAAATPALPVWSHQPQPSVHTDHLTTQLRLSALTESGRKDTAPVECVCLGSPEKQN